MADFSHLSVVSSEIRSNTPSSVKHEESQEPATLNTNFLSRETPFGAIALPGENETEPEPTLAVVRTLYRFHNPSLRIMNFVSDLSKVLRVADRYNRHNNVSITPTETRLELSNN